jgi:hypothetical protein
VGENAGTYFYELIRDALNEERDRKKSLENRAAFIVTSSGTLTTLLLGLVAVIADLNGSLLGGPSQLLLVVGVLMFGASAFLALRINSPAEHEESRAQGLKDLLEDPEVWLSESLIGMRSASANRLSTLDSFRSSNKNKAKKLVLAVNLELGGLASVALAVALVVCS